MINIRGLDKADLLVELYNNSHQQGLFKNQETKILTYEEAQKLVSCTGDFDYLYGKRLKLNLNSDKEFSEFLYDRDNGEGAAQQAVDLVRNRLEKGNTARDITKVLVRRK